MAVAFRGFKLRSDTWLLAERQEKFARLGLDMNLDRFSSEWRSRRWEQLFCCLGTRDNCCARSMKQIGTLIYERLAALGLAAAPMRAL